MGGILIDLARGLAAAALTVLVALVVPPAFRVPIVGVLLGFAAGVYPGFAQTGAQKESPGSPDGVETRLQWVVALGFAVIAVVGVALSAWWLAAGWTLHAAWDARHHGGRRGDWVPHGYPMVCFSYDLVLAAFAVWLALGGSA